MDHNALALHFYSDLYLLTYVFIIIITQFRSYIENKLIVAGYAVEKVKRV